MNLFAIFGKPVSHSKSPIMHNRAFWKLGFEGCYVRYELQTPQIKSAFVQLGLKGANITVPYKEEAYRECDEVIGIAKRVEAVNTIVNKNGRLVGYNTDAPGFLESVKRFLPARALIIGAGGTAKAIAEIFSQKGISFALLNRSAKRLEYFKQRGFETYTWDSFAPNRFDLIINTTSAGLTDDSLPTPPDTLKALFKEAKAAVDVIYGKETPFLKEAKSSGLDTEDGAEMLLQQGVLAFELFSEFKYPKNRIEKIMREALELS